MTSSFLPRHWFPVLGLALTTVAAWVVYFNVAFPHPWQARLLHISCFMPWTFFWHTSARGAFSWQVPLWLTFAMPVLICLGGEWIQGVIPAVGHDPEWRGVGASMLGIAAGWFLVWMRRRKVSSRAAS